MIEQRRHELAVVTAQIACEIEIQDAIEAAVDAPEGSLARMAIDASPSWSLIDKRARKVFAAIFGKAPTGQAWWRDYTDHVKRRNNILHRGARVTEMDARRSLGVTEELVDWVQAVRKG
jgi:hypothetical protein